MPAANLDLFPPETLLRPPGFKYSEQCIDADEELDLISQIQNLDFAPYELRGIHARRRVVSFGLRHGYPAHSSEPAAVVPLTLKAARFAGVADDAFRQVLVTEYTPGTPIGWHRDRALYEVIVGLSLKSAALLRFRRATEHGWDRQFQRLEPRSIYLLSAPARDQWQHSIPAVPALRYSITFRSLRPTLALANQNTA